MVGRRTLRLFDFKPLEILRGVTLYRTAVRRGDDGRASETAIPIIAVHTRCWECGHERDERIYLWNQNDVAALRNALDHTAQWPADHRFLSEFERSLSYPRQVKPWRKNRRYG
jgi:hypothetical protein